MDEKTWIGSLAEAKTAAALIQRGFAVFSCFGGKASCDLIALKDEQVIRVEVKGTAGKELRRGSYQVTLRSTRSNRTVNTCHQFDSKRSDLLAIYIEPLDVICFFPSAEFNGRGYVCLRMSPNNTSNHLPSWIIGDHLDLPREFLD